MTVPPPADQPGFDPQGQPQQPYGQAPYGQPDPAQQPYGQQPYAAQQPYGQPGGLSQSDERMYALFAHIGGIFFSFLVPLIIWIMFRERSRFVDSQGKEALNFQITLAIAYVVGLVTSVIFIGVFIIIAAGIYAIVCGIMAALAVNRGEDYRYPWAFRFIK